MHEEVTLSGLTIYTEQGVMQEASLEISKGKIKAIHQTPSFSGEKITFPGGYHLIPGLIDLHIHGANGFDVMDASHEALAAMSQALLAEGVTGYLATTMSRPLKEIEQALMAVKNFMGNQPDSGARLLGVHLEGPFISKEKCGAQCADHTLLPNISVMQDWVARVPGVVKIVTLAPELPGSVALIRYLKEQNIIAAMGHTQASFLEGSEAIEAGCSYVTHLFNAMSSMHQREPGLLASALLSDQVVAEIIADGVHVHPAMIELALKMKKKERLVLVTDAMRAKCLSDGSYDLGGQTVKVHNQVARLANGNLAGSTLTMVSSLKNIIKYTQETWADVLTMASKNQAALLNIHDKIGSLAPGKDADFVVLNENFDIISTWIKGKKQYQRSD